MIWLILVGIFAFLIWYNFVRFRNHFNKIGVKQSRPWPFFGDNWRVIFKQLSFVEYSEWAYNIYSNTRYSGFYQFTIPTLVLRDPELIKQVTVKDFDYFTDRRHFIDPDSDPLWRENLVALKGQKWRETRATLTGIFTSSKMKNMFGLMNEAAEKFTKYFLDKNEDVLEIEMKDAYTKYTTDVIATTAFGIKVDSLTEPSNDFYLMGKRVISFNKLTTRLKFFGYFALPRLFKLFKIRFFDKEVGDFFYNMINETIQVREEKGIVREDMINLLMETRKAIEQEDNVSRSSVATIKEADLGKFRQVKNLTNEIITSQALIFFLAGFETISTALCFGSYELALNKEIQDKLRAEIIETHAANDGKLTYDGLLKMKYLDMVVSEILRKWPPAPAMDRVATKPYTISPLTPDEKPLELKVGDLLWLPIRGLHRDPTFFPEPEKFDPDRFSDENKGKIRPYTYIPFGSGPRNCIGSRFALLETKTLLSHLLLNFEIVPIKRTPIPLKLSRTVFNQIAEGGFWLGLKRLKQ